MSEIGLESAGYLQSQVPPQDFTPAEDFHGRSILRNTKIRAIAPIPNAVASCQSIFYINSSKVDIPVFFLSISFNCGMLTLSCSVELRWRTVTVSSSFV